MKVLLLTGVLIICFTPIALGQHESGEFDLCKHNITSIDHTSDALKNVSSDTSHLFLCNNDLQTIDKNSLQRFKNLEKLVLDENRRLKFNSDGYEFLQLQSLTDLQCFRCGVDKLYNKSLQGMSHLETINLTHNRIHEIEVRAFYANKNLESIDLRSNQLKRVPSGMLSLLVKIRKIDLSYNNELAPEGSEPFLINTVLEQLSCDECGFVTVHENTFAKLPGLMELHLRRNKISTIHELAFPQKALTDLTLEGNVLKRIDPSILNMTNLNLCLDNNTNELECFLRDLYGQKMFVCSNTSSSDVECLAPTTISISTTSTTEVTDGTTDMIIIPVDSRISKTTNTSGKPETLSTSTTSGPPAEIVEGISDAYIGGYLTLIYLAQIVTFILLVGVWVKLKKYDTDPDVDRYAESIVNPNPIYKAVH